MKNINSAFENIDITTLIPQKHPFVMVDELVSFSPEGIVAGLTISDKNLFSNNGFLTEPGIVEHMAQSVALHTGCEFYLKNEKTPTGYIGAIKEIQIKKLPEVKSRSETTVTILQEFMGVTLVKIKVFSNGEEIASGEMKTVIAKN